MSSGKFGRGGGRGQSRMVPSPFARGAGPVRRGSGMMKDKGRMDDSKGRGGGSGSGNNGGGAVSLSTPSQEESFQLKLGTGNLYAMAIRITPGFIETLKRVEEQGGETQIKFSQHQSGAHVIRAGEEEIRFSSAPEPGHLCDIFEEKRRPEDGTGLLVESGSVWRKLSVQRTLSASEKDRVKMRSVEAERQQKSRKAIILDHTMSNKAAAPGDVNGRRPPPVLKGKKEPLLKKRKIETVMPTPQPPVKARPAERSSPSIAPPKTVKPAASPEPPQSASRAAAASQAAPAALNKGKIAEDAAPSPVPKAVPVAQRDKVLSPAAAAGNEAGSSSKTVGVVNLNELRNCLITLLADNPKGMTIKAVEKALGEAMPNVRPDKKQIEKVIKAIASYHAPGKYMLKEGVEKGGFAKPSPGSGSSPDTPAVESSPLAETPPLVETAQDAASDTAPAETPGENTAAALPDTRKVDVLNRTSSHPLQRGGESVVSRAIRKAGEKYAERSQRPGQEKTGADTDLQSQSLGVGAKESTTNLELVEVDHVDIGGDESPVVGSPDKERYEKSHALDVASDEAKRSPSHGVDNKKETSDGSDSSSGSDSDSDTNSGSGSGSASASGSDSDSDSDSDGSSSSASEDEKEDEDVRIISDDEDNGGANAVEASKQNQKSKDSKAAAQWAEGRSQKSSSRSKDHHKKQKQKGAASPHESDVDISDGEEGRKVPDDLSAEKIDCMGGADDMEVDIDVISCDGGSRSPQELGEASPADSLRDNVKAAPEIFPDATAEEEVKELIQDDLHAPAQLKNGSESDHSIEEQEPSSAEINGGRRARVKGDQKDEIGSEIKDNKDDALEMTSPAKSKVSVGAKSAEPMERVEREVKSDVATSQASNKGRDSADVTPMKDSYGLPGMLKGGFSLKGEAQKSLLGTPPFPRDSLDQGRARMHREMLNKSKGLAESKKVGPSKEIDSSGRFNKAMESGELPEKFSETPPSRPSVRAHTVVRTSKFLETSVKNYSEAETAAKSIEGVGKLCRITEDSGTSVKGTDMKESSDFVKSSRDGEAPERPDVQRRSNREFNREPGLLGKFGKDIETTGRFKEIEQISGSVREKDGNGLTRPVRDTKQVKKPYEKPDSFKRSDFADKAPSVSELAERSSKDLDQQRRMSRVGDSWRKSPKDMESVSSRGNDGESQLAKSKDSRKGEVDPVDAKTGLQSDDKLAREKELRHSCDLELGELRDIVAGEDLKGKEVQRNDGAKWRESSDMQRQIPSKAHISPDKEKPRKIGKQALDSRKSSLGEVKKQVSKADVPSTVRDTVRAPSGPQKALSIVDEKIDRAAEVTKSRGAYGDQVEKPDGKNGKRSAEDAGLFDSGRHTKRPVSGPPQVLTPAARGEPDIGKQDKIAPAPDALKSAIFEVVKSTTSDVMKGNHSDTWNQSAVINSSKAIVENGRVKSRGPEAADRVMPEKRGAAEQRITAGLLGPGSKKETPGTDLSHTNGVRAPSHVDGEWFAPYEKRAPELKGPITSDDQYEDYRKEFHEKYQCYHKLNTCLESDRDDFQAHDRSIHQAKGADNKKALQIIYSNVRRDYFQCRKRCKRMLKTFMVLHQELKVIKQRCKEYRERIGQG